MGALPCNHLLGSHCLCLSSRCIGMRTSDVIPSGIAVVDSQRLGRCTNTHRRNPAQRALEFGNTLVSTRYASRHLPMQANLNATQENQKNENTRRMDVQPYIYMSGKSPGKNVPANQPINSNPLLRIQTSNQTTCDPVHDHHTTVSCNCTKYWILPQLLPLSSNSTSNLHHIIS